MKQVAKCLITNSEGQILLLFRSATHPRWPLEGDFPGGSVEEDEDIRQAVAREINEEIGLIIDQDDIEVVFEKIIQTSPKKKYLITELKFKIIPTIKLSWEHSSYKLVSLKELMEDESNQSTDDYFQTVLEYLTEKGI